jgi:hypothetical protein
VPISSALEIQRLADKNYFSDEIRENKSALEQPWIVDLGRGAATQWGLVFTLMTLELGLVPLPLYARTR